MNRLLLCLVFFLLSSQALTAKKLEREYRDEFCNKIGGVVEHRLSDNARVDCLSSEYAIEVDFGKKWAEGIGQSLYYAQMTHKKPAVALIIAPGKEETYLNRLNHVAIKHGIRIFIIQK
jgi:hypothetical protein